MLGIFVDVLVPVFLVVGIGFALARAVGAKPRTLTALSYWVLGPAFVFDILSNADLEAGEVAKVVGASALTMALVGAAAAGAGAVIGAGRSLTSASILTSVYGNVGNFGLAISAFALGEEALPTAGVVMVTINTLGVLTGVGLAASRTQHWARAALRALLTPLALAVAPALAVNMTNTTLPLWFDRPVSLIAAALIPVMLLTLGVQLAGMERALPTAATAVPIALKLVAAPIVALGATTLLGLTGASGQVVIIQAAMPAAVFTSLVALEHDLAPDYVTSVVLAGTLASAITVPVVIGLLPG